MSRGAWTNIQASSQRTSITCLLSFQCSASWLWPCRKSISPFVSPVVCCIFFMGKKLNFSVAASTLSPSTNTSTLNLYECTTQIQPFCLHHTLCRRMDCVWISLTVNNKFLNILIVDEFYYATLQHYLDAAYCYGWSSVVCLLVCWSVCHDCKPCKNGWTDHDAI